MNNWILTKVVGEPNNLGQLQYQFKHCYSKTAFTSEGYGSGEENATLIISNNKYFKYCIIFISVLVFPTSQPVKIMTLGMCPPTSL